MTTSLLERHDVLRRLAEQHEYSPFTTPGEFMDHYLHLAVPTTEGMTFVRVHRYRIASSIPADSLRQKNRLLARLRQHWDRGELEEIRAWASGRGGEGRIFAPFNGKALPEEMILTCILAVRTGMLTNRQLYDWVDQHFGLDCSGFVNGYFIAIGRLRSEMIISSYVEPARTHRLTTVDQIGPRSVLVWANQNGQIPRSPGHIAVVDGWESPGRTLRVAESSGSLRGLHLGTYEITRTPAETRRPALWQVRRPNRALSWVYFAPPPGA